MSAITLDTYGAGGTATGPTTDSLTVPWSHNPAAEAGVLLAGFKYDTTAPRTSTITRTVTYNSVAMTPLVCWPKGWGLPSRGFVEVWGAIAPVTGAHNISVGLAYEQDTGDPWSPEHATFSNFSGGSATFFGANGFGRVGYRNGSAKMMTMGINAFQTHTTFCVLGSDGAISEEALEDNVIFLDAAKQLLLATVRGPGALKAVGAGGDYGAGYVTLTPA